MRSTGVLIAIVGVLASMGCTSEPTIVEVGLDIDLAPCLGAIDSVGIGDRDGGQQPVESTCRDNLDVTVADATVNTCLVMRELVDGSIAQRLPLQWSDGQLLKPFPERLVDLPSGRRLEASLFFLAVGDETGAVCDGLEVDSACEGDTDCVLKLHQDEVTPLADGGTVFDFTGPDGRCNAATGDAFGSASVEVCDGMDNDCDRVVDEGIPGVGDRCEDGVGACNVVGEQVCDPAARQVVCNAMPGQPRADEDCPAGDETCCDGIDDDCDGAVDENIACSPCADDAECADNVAGQQCVEGRCRLCDPNDHAGCADTELCCGVGGAFGCEPVSFGPADGEQCAACGTPCAVVRDGESLANADNCTDRTCQCGFGPACADPSPFCVGGACLECLGNDDCEANELCCDGRCEPTGPETQCDACGEPCDVAVSNRCVDRQCRCGEAEQCVGARAACIANSACDDDPGNPACSPRSFECEECFADLDCQEDGDASPEPACVDRQCRECKSDDDRFCAGPSAADGRPECVINDCFECDRRNHDGCAEDGDAPFCDVDQNTCRQCRDDAECQSRPGDLNQCVQGRCVVCDPETYEGCPDPESPICDRGSLTCQPCQTTEQCNANNEPDDLETECVEGQCRGCNPDGNQGCGSIGPTPICNPDTLVCRGCAGDDECPSVAPGSAEDADRDGDGPIAPASASPFCVDRQCRECNPDSHGGCDQEGPRPICRAGDCRACERDANCLERPGNLDQCIPDGPAAGLCKLCDPADNAGCDDPAAPVCDPQTFTCVGCAEDAECNRGRDPGLASLECVAGLCSQCDPRDGQLNVGCDPLSDVPICDGERNFCRTCISSAECVGLRDDRGVPVDLPGCVEGACTECDPVTQLGCPDTQICAPDGRCRACTVDADDPLNRAGDAECAQGEGDRDQCVDGVCEVCDPVDFAGCNPASGAPVCDAGSKTCRGCEPDAECEAGDNRPVNPVGQQCVAGFCRACDPSDGARNAGCDPVGTTPFCDPDQFNCGPCGTGVEGDDTRCEDNAGVGLDQCIGERCAQCDPNNHDGCAEADGPPFCDPGRAVCRACGNDAECFIRPGNRDQCVGGQCVVCDPADDAGCNNPNRPVCDDAQRTCRPCAADNECPGALLCVTGRCVQCDPGDNRGCDVASGTPFCDPGNSTCRACRLLDDDETGDPRDTECVGADLPQCVGGSCNECDPATHDGCAEDGPTPFCANGQCRACGNNAECVLRPGDLDYCSAGECVECNRDTEAGCPGDSPVCDDDLQSCRRCRNSTECVGNQECVDGTCVGCAPGTNDGCDEASTAPFCDGGTLVCRACAVDGECAGNPNGDQCYADRCVECDPSGAQQVGCNVGSTEPFCASDGECRECRADAECVIAPGDRDQCVGRRCEVCDPADDAGCEPTSDTPVCGGAAGNRSCRGCNNDGECSENPSGDECVGGSCVQCDPANNNGCDLGGAAPVCNAQSRTCVPCERDADCGGNPNGRQCVAGACEQCDPADSTGCGERDANPICDPATKSCVGCTNNAQCILRPGDLDVCVGPECKLCDPATNLGCGGVTPICDDGDACVGCTENDECGVGIQCLPDGSCAGCNPGNNAGCLADSPICDAGDRRCRPCRDDAECNGGYCFAGRCEVCDPEGHAGCGSDQLCCQNGAIFSCAETTPGTQCAACGVACDADGDPATNGSNVCADRTCRCGALVECQDDQPYCLGDHPDGACSECRDNGDCDALSDTPICGGDVQGNDSNTCRECANDDECRGHQRGEQCVASGACHVCDPVDDAGCVAGSNRPVCGDDFTCRGCRNDVECADNPNGGQCVRNRCVQCDPAGDAGCDDQSNAPVCIDGNVCGCAEDSDCNGNPVGDQCVGVICAECDPDAVGGLAAGGCDLDSDTPYCSPQSLTCVGCAGDDNRCPQGTLCDGERCVPCLLGSHDGCNADELCCGAGGQRACQAADTDACTACAGGGCDPEVANACDERECLCGAEPACEGGQVCAGGVCAECRDDVDCQGANGRPICDDGTCRECVTEGNRGCDPDSDAQICGTDNTCVACDDPDAPIGACAADPDLGNLCVLSTCQVCNPDNHAGCAADELCCSAAIDAPPTCVPADEDRCDDCLRALGRCNEGQVCENRECVDP